VRRPARRSQSDGLTRDDHDPGRTDLVAIITDGSRGVGREVARELAHRGFAILVGYITNQGAADATVEEVLTAGGAALTIRADVGDELDVERMFDEATEAFGGVDVVVHATGENNAGRTRDRHRDLDVDLDRFDALQRTVVRGTFLVNRQAARQIRDGGTIVNLSGSVVDPAVPTDAGTAASNAAVEAMTRVHARELRGRHVTVNAVAPRVDQPGIPTDVALMVAFLVDGDGRSLSGQIIEVDGGTAMVDPPERLTDAGGGGLP
jgi:3-oxoacyl-[acyl-carrier protein] reductase